MGETGFHVATILHLIGVLQAFFRKRNDVLVSGNQFMYWEPDDPSQVVAPDVYVIFGVASPTPRRTIKTWEEGKAPDVVFEITSRKTKTEDIRTKRALYEELGVREYFLFDPENDYLRPPLQGFKLVSGRYVPLGGETLHSELLGVDLRVVEGELRLFNAATGELLLDEAESAEKIEEQTEKIEEQTERIEKQAEKIEKQAKQLEAKTSELEEARRRAEAAQAEAARLRAENERLRRPGGP
jgi:Uma2 family endonuclease